MKKITLTEFWNSKNNIAIHCDTREKAKTLLRAFNKMGKKWCDDDSYLKCNIYNFYRKRTCYNNTGEYCSYDWYESLGYKIYEYEDVDLEN